MSVHLEIVFVQLVGEEAVRYFITRKELSDRTKDPDDLVLSELALTQAGGAPIHPEDCIVHSTSWRYDPGHSIVLTYMVYTDRVLFQAPKARVLDLADAPMASSPDPSRPRPRHIEEAHVVAHGIRHICHLVNEGQQQFQDRLTASSLRAFRDMECRLAGRLG